MASFQRITHEDMVVKAEPIDYEEDDPMENLDYVPVKAEPIEEIMLQHCEIEITDGPTLPPKRLRLSTNVEEGSSASECHVVEPKLEHMFLDDETSQSSFEAVEHLKSELSGEIDDEGSECSRCENYENSPHKSVHERVHRASLPYTCSTCNEGFSTFTLLKAHENAHGQSNVYECSACGEKFIGLLHLGKHKATKHKNEEIYECHYCGESFEFPYQVTLHERTHSEENAYSCATCGERFLNLKLLKSHQVACVETPVFTCESCKETFSQATQLKRHELEHRGNIHVCNVCKWTANSTLSLWKHELSHPEKYENECDDCKQKFKFIYELKKHQKVCCGE